MLGPNKGRLTTGLAANARVALFRRPERRSARKRLGQRPKPRTCFFGNDMPEALRARYQSNRSLDDSRKVIAALCIDEVERCPRNSNRREQAKQVADALRQIIRGVRLHTAIYQRIGD